MWMLKGHFPDWSFPPIPITCERTVQTIDAKSHIHWAARAELIR